MDLDCNDEVRIRDNDMAGAEADSNAFVILVWFICFTIGSIGNPYLKENTCRTSGSKAVNICPRFSTLHLDGRFCTHPYV